MLENELDTAASLARSAGKVIMKIYRQGFTIEEKVVTESYSEPVTAADREASRIIVAGLTDAFPGDAVLSEEEPDDIERRLASKRVWIVDPLDGTKGFTEKKGDFAVQIGLAIGGDPVLGVVFQPINDVLYYARRGGGALVSAKGAKPTKLRVSDKRDFGEMTIAVSRSHRSPRMSRIIEHFGFKDEFRHGSVGLKVGFLARQTADIYIHLSPYTKFWDTAAPQIVLEEAGGKMTDIFGRRLGYLGRDVRNHNGIFSCNSAAQVKALARLRPLLKEFGRSPHSVQAPV